MTLVGDYLSMDEYIAKTWLSRINERDGRMEAWFG